MEKWVICVEVNTLSTDSAALFLGRALEIFFLRLLFPHWWLTDKKKKRRWVINIPCCCCAHKVKAAVFLRAEICLISPQPPHPSFRPWQHNHDISSGTRTVGPWSMIRRQGKISGPLRTPSPTKQPLISRLQAGKHLPRCSEDLKCRPVQLRVYVKLP